MGEPVGVYIFWLGIVANIRQGQACYCFHVLLVPSFLMKQAPHCPSLKISNFRAPDMPSGAHKKAKTAANWPEALGGRQGGRVSRKAREQAPAGHGEAVIGERVCHRRGAQGHR